MSTCETCRFYSPPTEAVTQPLDGHPGVARVIMHAKRGECRRHAPAPPSACGDECIEGWPGVSAKDGCGDWQANG